MLRRNFLLLGVAGLPLVAGCGALTDIPKQVQSAIDSINEFNHVVDRTPENLRVAADKVIDKLKIEGRDFLAHDAQRFLDHALGTLGGVQKGLISFIDAKVKAYLEALKEALEEALPKIKSERSRDKILDLLRHIKINVKPLDPFVDLVNPNTLSVTRHQTASGQTKEIEFKGGLVELSGFGFVRPEDEKTDFRIEVAGNNNTRLLDSSLLSVSNPFSLLMNLSTFKPLEGDQKLSLFWGKTRLTEVPFNWINVSTPVPTVISGAIVSRTGDEDREQGRGYRVYMWLVDNQGNNGRPILATDHFYDWFDGPTYPRGSENSIDLSYNVPKQSGSAMASFPAGSTVSVRILTHDDLNWSASFRFRFVVRTEGRPDRIVDTPWTEEARFRDCKPAEDYGNPRRNFRFKITVPEA